MPMPPMPTKWMATLRFPNTGKGCFSPEPSGGDSAISRSVPTGNCAELSNDVAGRVGTASLTTAGAMPIERLTSRDRGQLGDDVARRRGARERAHRRGHARVPRRILKDLVDQIAQ